MSRRFRKVIVGGAGLLSLIGYQMYQSKSIRIDMRELRYKDLPEDLEDFKICHISDLQGAVFGNGNEKPAGMINALNADVICITGDMVHKDADDGEAFLNLISQLDRDKLKIFVPGNHESTKKNLGSYERLNREVLYRKLEMLGVKILRGDSFTLTEYPITFSGMDDDYSVYEGQNYSEEDFSPSEYLPMVTEGNLNAALVHRPYYFRKIADYGYDLILTGNTSRGLPGTAGRELVPNGEKLLRGPVKGLYKYGQAFININSGLGQANPFSKIGARPEIVLLVLRKGDPELMNMTELR